MGDVSFKFEPKQKVKTIMDDEAIVDMAAYDGHVISYYVKLKGGKGQWFDEDQLTDNE